MVESDFAELAKAGVKLLGEIGLWQRRDGPTGHKMVEWAQARHPVNDPHGRPVDSRFRSDRQGRGAANATPMWSAINGGHTALPDDQIRCICEGVRAASNSSTTATKGPALYTLRVAREMKELERVILGGRAGGFGRPAAWILRMVSMLSSLGDIPAEIAFCFATGNTARMRRSTAVRSRSAASPISSCSTRRSTRRPTPS